MGRNTKNMNDQAGLSVMLVVCKEDRPVCHGQHIATLRGMLCSCLQVL